MALLTTQANFSLFSRTFEIPRFVERISFHLHPRRWSRRRSHDKPHRSRSSFWISIFIPQSFRTSKISVANLNTTERSRTHMEQGASFQWPGTSTMEWNTASIQLRLLGLSWGIMQKNSRLGNTVMTGDQGIHVQRREDLVVAWSKNTCNFNHFVKLNPTKQSRYEPLQRRIFKVICHFVRFRIFVTWARKFNRASLSADPIENIEGWHDQPRN